jgi:hypothetical protein
MPKLPFCDKGSADLNVQSHAPIPHAEMQPPEDLDALMSPALGEQLKCCPAVDDETGLRH